MIKKTPKIILNENNPTADSKEDFIRGHAEFHNCYKKEMVQDNIRFLKLLYGDKLTISIKDVDEKFILNLKACGRDIYFFMNTLEKDFTPQDYIKRKYEFITNRFQNNHYLFFLAWNGLTNNDSFKRILLKTFSLSRYNDKLCPQHISQYASNRTRYRTKLVLADDMAINPDGSRRTRGRILDDGSGLKMREGIIWLSNGKAIPLFPQAYVPLNQTHIILIRHGRSIHNSGGDNPKFVGSGYWDTWKDNRRVSHSVSNYLHGEGIEAAKELGKNFKVCIETLAKEGYPLWTWSKENPISVFGSESQNTEETARYFLEEAGHQNLSFNSRYGLNSQKYGALTHKFKKDIIAKTVKIYGEKWGGTLEENTAKAKAIFKNRFFHFPEGETLIESDWRIAHSFVELLENNLGKRIVLADHSGAIRVFEAVIRTLDFADYKSRKERQDSIIAMCYQRGKNLRYDHLQRKDFILHEEMKEKSN